MTKVFSLCLCLVIFSLSLETAHAACRDSDADCRLKELLGVSPSSWKGYVHSTVDDKYSRGSTAVEITPASKSSGTWTSNPFNLCSPGDQLFLPGAPFDYTERGAWSGKYKIVGSTLFTYELKMPNTQRLGYSRSCQIEAIGSTLRLTATRSDPSPVTELKRK